MILFKEDEYNFLNFNDVLFYSVLNAYKIQNITLKELRNFCKNNIQVFDTVFSEYFNYEYFKYAKIDIFKTLIASSIIGYQSYIEDFPYECIEKYKQFLLKQSKKVKPNGPTDTIIQSELKYMDSLKEGHSITINNHYQYTYPVNQYRTVFENYNKSIYLYNKYLESLPVKEKFDKLGELKIREVYDIYIRPIMEQ